LVSSENSNGLHSVCPSGRVLMRGQCRPF
jgi:hypothetical protein